MRAECVFFPFFVVVHRGRSGVFPLDPRRGGGRAVPSESELTDPALSVSSPVAGVTVLGAEPLCSEGSECVKRVGGAGPP